LPGGRNEELAARASQALRQFEESLDGDLNTAEALAAVFEYIRETNSVLDQDQFPEGNRADAAAVLDAFDRVFDVLRTNDQVPGLRLDLLANRAPAGPADEEINQLVAERTAAKRARNFARADEIRNLLVEQGILIEDTKDGVRWKRK
jgi:cysteinyl-tRNA synthetase